jgi:hypothetical protein
MSERIRRTTACKRTIEHYAPYQPRDQELGEHRMIDIEEVDIENVLDFVFLIINNAFTRRMYQPIRPSR